MKITVNQLRRIIKEEVKRSLLRERSMGKMPEPNWQPERPEPNGQIKISNVSMIAEKLGISLEKLVDMIEGAAQTMAVDVSFKQQGDNLLGFGPHSSLKNSLMPILNKLGIPSDVEQRIKRI